MTRCEEEGQAERASFVSIIRTKGHRAQRRVTTTTSTTAFSSSSTTTTSTIQTLSAFPNLVWCHTSARQCDVLSTTVPRHPAQIGQPPRQQPMASPNDRPAAGAAVCGGSAAAVAWICSVHERRPPAPSRPPPPAPTTTPPPPKFHVPLSISTQPTHTPTATTAYSRCSGLSGQRYTRGICALAKSTHQMRGELRSTFHLSLFLFTYLIDGSSFAFTPPQSTSECYGLTYRH